MDSDMQRAYQKNMVIGSLTAFSVVALVALCLTTLPSSRSPVSPDYLRDSRESVAVDTAQQGGSGSHAVLGGFHGGFIRSLRIISDAPLTTARPSALINHVSFADLEPVVTDSAPGIGDGTGDGIGSGDGDCGLPELPFPPMREFSPPNYSLNARPVNVRRTPADRELCISGFHDPRVQHRVIRMKGIATVEMTVTASGSIRAMRVIGEEPKGYGLGQALMTELNNCIYYPAIICGKKVDMTISVTYEFNSEGTRTVRTSKNVIMSMR